MLTSAQLATLKAAILADPTFNGLPDDQSGNTAIADAFNAPAAPEFWVWKTRLSKKEAVEATSTDPDGTTNRIFNWTGAGFITRSQGERDAWREIWNHVQETNPSLANVRQAFVDIFSGATAPAPSNRTHLANVSRRPANRGEALFAAGTGTAASPATMTFEGELSFSDVNQARNAP